MTGEERSETKRCGVWTGCSRMATVHIEAMCVHEHLRIGDRCDVHAGLPRRGYSICLACRDGSEPHSCSLTVLAETSLSDDRVSS